MRFIPLAACAFVLACGSENPPPRSGTVFSDSAGIRIATSDVGEDSPRCLVSEPSVVFGNDPTQPASDLYAARDGTVLDDGRVAILNEGSHQVKIFSADGSLASEFGRAGDGPGEFRRNLWNIQFRPPDTLVVGESRTWRFSTFTVDGEFIGAVEPDPHVIERPIVGEHLTDGDFVLGLRCCRSTDVEFSMEYLSFTRYSPDGIRIDSIGTFPYHVMGAIDAELRYFGTPIFASTGLFEVLPEGGFLYGDPRSPSLRLFGPDGSLQQIVRWTSRDRDVSAADVNEWRQQEISTWPTDREPSRFSRASVREDRPVADEFPAYDQVLVGRQGETYVREYRRPLDEGPARWLVFEPEGAFRCLAAMDPSWQLVEAGVGYILSRFRDDFDVEYFALASLDRPN